MSGLMKHCMQCHLNMFHFTNHTFANLFLPREHEPPAPSTITARVEPPPCRCARLISHAGSGCEDTPCLASLHLHGPGVSWPIRNHNRHINLHSVTFCSFKTCKLFAEYESQRQSIAMQNAKCNSLRSTFGSDKWSEEGS